MAFKFEGWMVNHYLTQGHMVFRGIVPPSLLRDLRREADKARGIAHEHGRSRSIRMQRIQPIKRYADKLDFKPFQEYAELPELHDAVTRLLGPGYHHSNLDILGLLVEPADRPWCHGWHRDAVVEVPPAVYDEQLRATLAEAWHDLTHFNQVNCALYNDSCTWYVPGSHLRQWDLPGESQSAESAWLRNATEGMSDAEAEYYYLEHCRSFPGAVQMHLGPGDFMVYRNQAWHCGNYIPSQPRATIHDIVWCETDDGWRGRWNRATQAALQRLEARADGESAAGAARAE